MKTDGPKVIGPGQGRIGRLRGMGVRFMVSGDEYGGGFALVEHPMPRRPWGHRSTGTTARTSTASSSRVG